MWAAGKPVPGHSLLALHPLNLQDPFLYTYTHRSLMNRSVIQKYVGSLSPEKYLTALGRVGKATA
jgi:hypothetical protein